MQANVVRALFGESLEHLSTTGMVDPANGKSLDRSDISDLVATRRQSLAALKLSKDIAIGVWIAPPLEFIVNYLAVIAEGLVAVPLDREWPQAELMRRCRLCGVELAIGRDASGVNVRSDVGQSGLATLDLDNPQSLELREGAAAGRGPVLPADTAQVLFTSGSSGPSKAVLISHTGMLRNVEAAINWGTYNERDCFLVALPLFHAYSLVHCIMTPLAIGAGCVFAGRYSTGRVLDIVDRNPVTVLPCVPAYAQMVIRHERSSRVAWAPLRFAFSGGAVLNSETQRQFVALTGAPLWNGYGMTEATSFVSGPPPGTTEQAAGSIGWAVDGVKVRVNDIDGGRAEVGTGELEIGGPSIMLGYLGDAEATAATLTDDGWLRSGDLVSILPDGEMIYEGRLRYIINRGGEKVHPERIEEVVGTVPWVEGAAAVGVPDEVMGEEIVCVVQARKSDFDVGLLKDLCELQLTKYERPQLFIREDEIPRTPTGKISHQHARDLAVEIWSRV